MNTIDTSKPFVRAFAPGRTELAGNHTDHQGGRVIASTVDCGVSMEVQATGLQEVCLASEGFAPVTFDCADVQARDAERSTTTALVKGVMAGLREAGVAVGGFAASVRSDIPAGGGLSSSAAFELALACALVKLFGRGVLDAEQLARIAQRAEREWFGKPCGLMDQLSVALGGVQVLDFGGETCAHKHIQFDFERAGYALCLVDTHCDHGRYTNEYAQVAKDMDEVARYLGAEVLSEVPRRAFARRFNDVRAALGDAAALRALHYYHEMSLVDKRVEALEQGDVEAFLDATRRSGSSSAQYLQNVSTADRASQPAMVALALCDFALGAQGAVRIHGGGFGGTVQAFVPIGELPRFIREVDALLGDGSCRSYELTDSGARAWWVEGEDR